MTEHADVPPEIVAELRSVCLGLPEAYEEQALGRYAVAHPQADLRPCPHGRLQVAAGVRPGCGDQRPDHRADVPVFGSELEALGGAGHPFFRPPWRADEVGRVFDKGVNWDEVAELVTESYCILAPRSLVDLVERPTE